MNIKNFKFIIRIIKFLIQVVNMKINILDTTLRDGEQTPGVSLTSNEKLRIARALDEIGVNIIEAGSAITSDGEKFAIRQITSQDLDAEIASFARSIKSDIDVCLDCGVDTVNLVVPTSDIHIDYKLKSSRQQVQNEMVENIEYAKDYGLTVELSAEDASRTDMNFLVDTFKLALDAKADRLCPCDTVGVLTPERSFDFYSELSKLNAKLGVHCHNDYGLAVANSLQAIRAGASEVHGTINGIGERAGNASLEEIVVSLNNLYEGQYSTDIKINQLYNTSIIVSRSTGVYIQPNKAIVGENVFAHESGIHADGVIKNASTYESITPELLGRRRKFVVGKHTGTKGLNSRLIELGIEVNNEQLNSIFKQVKDFADNGKCLTDVDLQAIADNVLEKDMQQKVNLEEVTIVSGNKITPTASVRLKIDEDEILEAGIGLGPVDAAINAVKKSINEFANVKLEEYHVDAITGGTDALIDVIVKVSMDDEVISARGTDSDIINASVEAYLTGVNRLLENKDNL